MIVSSSKVILIVVLAIVGAIQLVPEKSELMSRVIEDGDMSRALELIGEKPDVQAFDDLVEEYSTTSSPGIFKRLTVLVSLSDNPAKNLKSVISIEDKFRDYQKRELCSLFAKRSLELNQLNIAVATYQWLAQSMVLKDEELEQAIKISRYAGDPRAAIDFISGNMKQKDKSYEDLPEEKRTLLVTLNREVNQGDQALNLLKKDLAMNGNNWNKWSILDKLVTVAIQSNRMLEVLPILEMHIRDTEVGRLSWQEVLNRKNTHRSDAKFLQFAKTIGQNYEWNSKAQQAFPYYFKLAVLGDSFGMERCFSLYEWAQQSEPMMALLAHTPFHRLSYLQVLEYAGLEAANANFDKAEKLLETALTFPEADLSSIYQQKALIILQKGNLNEALADFEIALRYNPSDFSILDQIASIYASQGRHHKALDAYSRVPLDGLSKEGMENYKLLASTLESDYDQLRIARHILKSPAKHSEKTYIEIAEIFSKHVYDREAFEALALGLSEYPECKKLQFAKIDLLMDNEAYDSAFEEIKLSYDPADPRYHQRVIAVGEAVRDSKPMLELLNLKDPKAGEWDPGLRLELASLYEKMEKFDIAADIWESYDPGTVNLKRLNAKLAFQKGRYSRAVELQEDYIKTTNASDPYEWEFLGDIYLLTNRSAESQRAYTVAMEKGISRYTHRL